VFDPLKLLFEDSEVVLVVSGDIRDGVFARNDSMVFDAK